MRRGIDTYTVFSVPHCSHFLRANCLAQSLPRQQFSGQDVQSRTVQVDIVFQECRSRLQWRQMHLSNSQRDRSFHLPPQRLQTHATHWCMSPASSLRVSPQLHRQPDQRCAPKTHSTRCVIESFRYWGMEEVSSILNATNTCKVFYQGRASQITSASRNKLQGCRKGPSSAHRYVRRRLCATDVAGAVDSRTGTRSTTSTGVVLDVVDTWCRRRRVKVLSRALQRDAMPTGDHTLWIVARRHGAPALAKLGHIRRWSTPIPTRAIVASPLSHLACGPLIPASTAAGVTRSSSAAPSTPINHLTISPVIRPVSAGISPHPLADLVCQSERAPDPQAGVSRS
jgi:hypothetical protein